jgi:Cellulase (glycosyl hydrolase family 5)
MSAMQRRGWTLASKLALALVLACSATLLWASEGGALSARSAPLSGINITGASPGDSFAKIDHEISIARQLHAQVVRVAMPWALFEPSPGQTSAGMLAAANRVMQDASSAHIGVIALVDDTPCWASSAPAALQSACVPGRVGPANAWPPSQASYFGTFVGQLAKRYGDELTAIEIWNEPDQANQQYLAGPQKPQRYAEMLRAAYPAIKSADPNIKVLAGSLVGSNGAFMQALYKQGVKGYYDGISVHFYNLVLASVRRFHEVQLENQDSTPLWLDEFGWTSCWPRRKTEQEQGCVTRAVQAQNVTNAFRELTQVHYIAAMLPYGLQDVPGEEFGIFGVGGKRKPSYYALARSLQSPFGSPSKLSLKLRVKHGQVVASGSGPVGDYLKLEVLEHGALRFRAIFTLNRFNEFSYALPAALGTKGLTVRVYQYWMSSSDAQRSI